MEGQTYVIYKSSVTLLYYRDVIVYVLFLFSDKSMETLFKNGEGPVFYEMIKWLDSDIDHLKLSGALAVGNFARNGILFIVFF